MASSSKKDRWAQWLASRRDGGDAEQRRRTLESLAPVRERVLDGAGLSEGDTLLDVGAGEGLIAFGALDRVGESGRVVFSDLSRDLLDHSRSVAEEAGVAGRCSFVEAPADDLSALPDASVDAVTTRSVLIYVQDKRRAFAEFRRVLGPGGRLSLFEPINRFGHPAPPDRFLGYDVAPVRDLARRVWAVYERLQPIDTDPMLDFDERDLLALADEAGFDRVSLSYEAAIGSDDALGHPPKSWKNLLASSGNPNIPTLGEAIHETLTPDEAERLAAHLRPLVERGERRASSASAYLRAVR